MSYWIFHPHIWTTEEGFGLHGGYYDNPAHALGSYDLTPLSVRQSAQIGVAHGVRFVEVSKLPADPSMCLLLCDGDPRECRPDSRILDGWESWTGRRPEGDTIAACLVDHLTNGADPLGYDRCFPILPGRDLRTKIWCANRLLYDEPFVMSQATIDHLKATLSTVRGDARDGKLGLLSADEDYHRRIATALCEKYRCDFELIRPALWPAKETPLPHSTVKNDTFVRANQTNLGTASDGFSWSEQTGHHDIVSNQASGGTTANRSRADIDMAGADTYAETTNAVPNGAINVGLMLRYASGANSGYEFLCRNNATLTYRIFNCSAGSESLIDTAVNATAFASGSIHVEANGSSLTLTANGVLRKTVSDGSYPSNLRGGLYSSGGSGSTFADFEVGDLAGAVARRDLMLLGVGA